MLDSYEERKRIEREKAIQKYGEVALAPSGHPDYDVLDYAINEVVGIDRYAEMVLHRVSDLRAYGIDMTHVADAISGEMSEFSQDIARRLIELRKTLQFAGIDLGKPETR